jgi:hypothetical protein
MRRIESLNGVTMGLLVYHPSLPLAKLKALWRLGRRVVSRRAPRYGRGESGNKT